MNENEKSIDLGIVGMVPMGEYDSEKHYEKLNIVFYNGSSYAAKRDVVGVEPTDSDYWDLIAEKGRNGDTGPEGPKPVKGVDYYTAEDKAEIKLDITSEVHNEVVAQVGNISNGTPLPANSMSDMIDTTRLYVLTSDGYVYYYNGTAWTKGWIYQETSLSDNDVHINNLDEFIDEQIGVKNVNTQLIAGTFINYISSEEESNPSFGKSSPIRLLKGETIIYKSKNTALVAAISLTDSEETFYTPVVRGTGTVQSEASVYKYKATEDCYVILSSYVAKGQPNPMYISYLPYNFDPDNIPLLNFEVIQKNHIDYLFKTENKTISPGNSTGTDFFINTSFEGKQLYLNTMLNQEDFIENNLYAIAFDSNNEIIGSYGTRSVSKQKYIVFRIPQNTTKISVGIRNYGTQPINLEYFTVSLNKTVTNPLYGKSMIAFGDSITQGANNDGVGGKKSYASIIADRNSMNFKNYAVSGGSIVNSTGRFYIGGSVDTAIDEKTFMECDYIIISGGLNDTSRNTDNPVGTFSMNDFSGNYDETTILGEIETMFYKLKNHFIGNNQMAKIVYVLTYQAPDHVNWYEVREKIKQLCSKWGIKAIDIGELTGLVAASNLAPIRQQFLTDGIHPNNAGYEMMATVVENIMKSL